MQDLHERAYQAGIWLDYTDQTGAKRQAPPETLDALLNALGPDLESGIGANSYQIVHLGDAFESPAAPGEEIQLTLEDGTAWSGCVGSDTAPFLPLGLHRLDWSGGQQTLIVAPERLELPKRGWGVTLPLYGLGDGAIGSFDDLGEALKRLSRLGAGFVGINPIHAGFFPDPGEYSPYAPSHRRRLNAAHIALDGLAAFAGPLIDYPQAFDEKSAALEAAFQKQRSDPEFQTFWSQQSPSLHVFATHQALSEQFGRYWSDWPAEYQNPQSQAVFDFAAAHKDRVLFHGWLQYVADKQLSNLSKNTKDMRHGLYLDLAVGTHPFGAETWLEPDTYARSVSLGAPPDAFAPDGQEWGLAPLNPRALIRAGFKPFAEMLRMQFKYAGMLRIDHILGFERAFWIPQGDLPGTYVAMPRDALLAVTRLEATRAGAIVVGEDLGNIPDGLRQDLDASGLLGCRVVMFELDENGAARGPEEYAEASLASFGTHDLPPYRGWSKGRDIELRHNLGLISDETRAAADATRVWEAERLTQLAGGESSEDLLRVLASTASRLVALQIEDILEFTDQPNLPGTIDTYPNWRRRLPSGFLDDERLAQASKIMQDSGR